MTRSLLLALAAIAFIACSAADEGTARRDACEGDDCYAPARSSSPSPARADEDTPTTPVETKADDPAAPDAAVADAAPAPDAAAPDAATISSCTALAACCVSLKSVGYDPTVCNAAVATKKEATCASKLASYKSFGDC